MTHVRCLIAWSLAASFAPAAAGARLQERAPDERGPSPIEQALIEHACSALASGVADNEAYQTCLSNQLTSLRADFGRDLSRLSGTERKTLDSVCSKMWATRGRDVYVTCLSAQLVSLRNRRNRLKPAAPNVSAPTTLPSPSVAGPSSGPITPAPRLFSRSTGLWIGVAVVMVCAAAAGILTAVKARRTPGKCRVCGVNVLDRGELCQECRHEAAEVHRAAAEQADNLRAQEEELRRQRDEESRQQQAREEEELLLRQREQARREEQAHLDERAREEEASRRRAEASQPTPFDAAARDELDPCAVLGLAQGASMEEIRAAYEEAKTKYDVEQVAHLGPEVQDHFKAKAQAVERAYQQLTRVPSADGQF